MAKPLDHWILDKYLNLVRADLYTWAKFFDDMEQRRIAFTRISARITVSTVFLGIDYSFNGGPPLVFESLVFGGKHDGEMLRYSSYDEAVKGHNELVAMSLKTHRRRDPLEHYVRKKLARPLEFYKEDTKSILKGRLTNAIKNIRQNNV